MALDLPLYRLRNLLELSHKLSNNLGLVAAWLELSSGPSANWEERILIARKLADQGRTTLEQLMRELQEIDRDRQSG